MTRKEHITASGKMIVTDHIDITMQVALRDEVIKAADKENKPMTEWVRDLLAKHFKKPHLAVMPRDRAGRPRKNSQANGNEHSRKSL